MSTTTHNAALESSRSQLDIYTQMQHLCAQAHREAGLFRAYHQDLTVHDRSYIADDAQAGDTLLWIIKECGTWLTLVDPGRSHAIALLKTLAVGDRVHLIEVQQHTGRHAYGRIRAISPERAREAVDSVRADSNRRPRRVFLSEHLAALGLDGTVIPSDLSRISAKRGESAYLHFERSTVRLLAPSAGIDRVLGRAQQSASATYKIDITSNFGHAELHVITAAAFQRRLKAMERSPRQQAA